MRLYDENRVNRKAKRKKLTTATETKQVHISNQQSAIAHMMMTMMMMALMS